jgi:hypothetical protein
MRSIQDTSFGLFSQWPAALQAWPRPAYGGRKRQRVEEQGDAERGKGEVKGQKAKTKGQNPRRTSHAVH